MQLTTKMTNHGDGSSWVMSCNWEICPHSPKIRTRPADMSMMCTCAENVYEFTWKTYIARLVSTLRPANGDAVDPSRWLPHPDGDALALLAAHADAGIERHVVAEH